MQRQLETDGMKAEVFSRGLLAILSQHPPKEAQQAALEFDIDLARHVSQPLLPADLDRAGMVLVMDAGQRQHISAIRPSCIGKVFLLSEPSGGRAIADPMGRDMDAFRRVYTEISVHVDAWIQRFGL